MQEIGNIMLKSRFVLVIACAMSFFVVDFVEVQAKSNKDPIFKKPLLFRRAKEYQREQRCNPKWEHHHLRPRVYTVPPV